MPSNPMQRKVRNSFLLGILVMLLVAILIGVIVFLLVIKPSMDKKKEEEQQLYAYVYRIKPGTNIKSGEDISASMLEIVQIPVNTNTTDFITNLSEFEKNLVDENGEEIVQNRYKSKVNLSSGTILTRSVLYENDKTEDSLRYSEYSMITMPTSIDIDDYVDVRLRLPNGQDLIVISKKQIVNLYNRTVGLNLTEEEIVILNSAIVETYIMQPSAELYMTKYVEPGLQEAAIYTYTPTAEVQNLISIDGNIVAKAKEELNTVYNKIINIDGGGTTTQKDITRTYINNELNKYSEEKKDNIEAGMQEQIEAARKAREDYLAELNGY